MLTSTRSFEVLPIKNDVRYRGTVHKAKDIILHTIYKLLLYPIVQQHKPPGLNQAKYRAAQFRLAFLGPPSLWSPQWASYGLLNLGFRVVWDCNYHVEDTSPGEPSLAKPLGAAMSAKWLKEKLVLRFSIFDVRRHRILSNFLDFDLRRAKTYAIESVRSRATSSDFCR